MQKNNLHRGNQNVPSMARVAGFLTFIQALDGDNSFEAELHVRWAGHEHPVRNRHLTAGP